MPPRRSISTDREGAGAASTATFAEESSMAGSDISCRAKVLSSHGGAPYPPLQLKKPGWKRMAALPETLAAPSVAPAGESRLWIAARTAFPFLVLGGLWGITAHSGLFPPRLFPPLEVIGAALVRLT